MQIPKPTRIEILSYIGLVLFTVIVAGYRIPIQKFDVYLIIAFIMSYMLLPVFLLICFGAIIYTSVKCFLPSRRIHNFIVILWSVLLIVVWKTIPEYELYVNAWIQEEYYEKHKKELWDVAHQVDKISKNTTGTYYIWKEDNYDKFPYKECGLKESEFNAIKGLLEKYNYPRLSYNDSICSIGFRYNGMGLYTYDLYLKPVKPKDDYTLIIYNDSVVFTYGSGAFGDDDYATKKEYLAEKKKKK